MEIIWRLPSAIIFSALVGLVLELAWHTVGLEQLDHPIAIICAAMFSGYMLGKVAAIVSGSQNLLLWLISAIVAFLVVLNIDLYRLLVTYQNGVTALPPILQPLLHRIGPFFAEGNEETYINYFYSLSKWAIEDIQRYFGILKYLAPHAHYRYYVAPPAAFFAAASTR
jgi:hypothetical protein